MECDVVLFGTYLQIFRKNLLNSSSGEYVRLLRKINSVADYTASHQEKMPNSITELRTINFTQHITLKVIFIHFSFIIFKAIPMFITASRWIQF
jgi:hypothetical protein